MSTAGLILAAGESRRMGAPKALLEYQGETFLDRLIGLFAERCAPVIVVLGADRDRIRSGMRRRNAACLVDNPDFERGQLASMQCGLRAIPPATEAVLFTLVDHPAVQPGTISALLDAPSAATIRIPRFASRRGHPILFSKSVAADFLALSPDATARDVLERHAGGICYIDVDDPGVLADVDDPESYQRLRAGCAV